MTITITTDENPISWDESEAVDDQTAVKAARILAERIAEGMRAAYPGVEVTAETKWHVEGETIKLCAVSGADVDTWEQVQGEAAHLQTAHHYDALAEAIA